MRPEKVAAILTAAGRSERMGRPKALLDWGGRTLLRHQIEVLQEVGIGETIVVLGHWVELLGPEVPRQPGIRAVYNRDYPAGRASSIRCGVSALAGSPDALAIVAVDQPLESGPLRELIMQFDPGRWTMAQPVVGDKAMHPVVFAGQLRWEIAAVEEATQGLRHVVQRWRHLGLRVPVEGRWVGCDLNTLDDYRRIWRDRG